MAGACWMYFTCGCWMYKLGCALNEQRLWEVKLIWTSNDSVHRGDRTRHWKTDTVSTGLSPSRTWYPSSLSHWSPLVRSRHIPFEPHWLGPQSLMFPHCFSPETQDAIHTSANGSTRMASTVIDVTACAHCGKDPSLRQCSSRASV